LHDLVKKMNTPVDKKELRDFYITFLEEDYVYITMDK